MYLYASENNPISIFSMAITLLTNTCSQCSFPVAHIPSRKDTDFASIHAKYFFFLYYHLCVLPVSYFCHLRSHPIHLTCLKPIMTEALKQPWPSLQIPVQAPSMFSYRTLGVWSWTWQPKATDFLFEDSWWQLLFG